jgi:hypothetical protein
MLGGFFMRPDLTYLSVKIQRERLEKSKKVTKERFKRSFKNTWVGGKKLINASYNVVRGTVMGVSLTGISAFHIVGGIYNKIRASRNLSKFQKTNQEKYITKYQSYHEGSKKRFQQGKNELKDAFKHIGKNAVKAIKNAGKGTYRLSKGILGFGLATLSATGVGINKIKLIHRERQHNHQMHTREPIWNIREESPLNEGVHAKGPTNPTTAIERSRKLGYEMDGKQKLEPTTRQGRQLADRLLHQNRDTVEKNVGRGPSSF